MTSPSRMVRFPRKAKISRPNMYNESIEEEDIENDSNTNDNGGIGLGNDPDVVNIDNHQEEGSDQDPRPIKKKRYHRHTQEQILAMEAFFKECPHPDDKQQKELSRDLGLDQLQIKHWFQNKRTQNKTIEERLENSKLRTENEKLRADNNYYREAIAKAACPNCGNQTAVCDMSFDELRFRFENDRLRKALLNHLFYWE